MLIPRIVLCALGSLQRNGWGLAPGHSHRRRLYRLRSVRRFALPLTGNALISFLGASWLLSTQSRLKTQLTLPLAAQCSSQPPEPALRPLLRLRQHQHRLRRSPAQVLRLLRLAKRRIQVLRRVRLPRLRRPVLPKRSMDNGMSSFLHR